MWTFTLLEEHSGNLEFCSPGNSHVKSHLSFLCFPMDSQALGSTELSVPHTCWQGEQKALWNQRPQSGKAPLLWPLPEPDPAGFTAASWGPWNPSSSGWGWGRQVLGANCSMAWHAGWQEVRHPCLWHWPGFQWKSQWNPHILQNAPSWFNWPFSSENNFFRKPSSIAKSFLSSAVELFEKQPRLSCSERLFRFPGIGRTLVPLNQVGRGKIITMWSISKNASLKPAPLKLTGISNAWRRICQGE